jgi:hypothetical protein
VIAHHEIDLGDVGLTRAFDARARGVEHLLEGHRCLVWRLRELAQADVLHDDIDLVGGRGRQERFERAALLVLCDRGVRQARLEEGQRVGVLALHGRADAAEMLHDKLRQEVLRSSGVCGR